MEKDGKVEQSWYLVLKHAREKKIEENAWNGYHIDL